MSLVNLKTENKKMYELTEFTLSVTKDAMYSHKDYRQYVLKNLAAAFIQKYLDENYLDIKEMIDKKRISEICMYEIAEDISKTLAHLKKDLEQDLIWKIRTQNIKE